MPGYQLLCVFVGTDPITDQRVDRTPLSLARAVLDLVPRGQEFLEALQHSGGLQRAYEVIQQGWTRLNITWEYVQGLLRRMVDAIEWLHPIDSAQRMAAILEEPARRVRDFALSTGSSVLEVIFDAAMSLLGPRAQRVSDILKRARAAFTTIIQNPGAFVGHLMDALKQGFRQFGGHILQHLGQGLITWLTGALSSAGIQLPAQWDFRGVLSIALQVLGLTWNSIRTKLVRAIGERAVAIAETAMPFLVTLVRQGPAAAWQQLLQYIGNVRDTVINGIQEFVRNTVVMTAIERVANTARPRGRDHRGDPDDLQRHHVRTRSNGPADRNGRHRRDLTGADSGRPDRRGRQCGGADASERRTAGHRPAGAAAASRWPARAHPRDHPERPCPGRRRA